MRPHTDIFKPTDLRQLHTGRSTKGQSISQTLGATRWAEEIAPTLAHRIKGMQPYDIQEFCRQYLRDEFNPDRDLELKIKATAFENGIDRHQVLDVLAVELRDKLLTLTS